MNPLTKILSFISLVISLLPLQSAAVTCRTDIVASTPDQDFTIHNDGTVTHRVTGLMWMRCSLGQSWDGSTCSGGASGYFWVNALAAAENHSFAGYSDWRLPNKNELESLLERRCVSPSINRLVFPNTPGNSWFWSSSPYTDYSNSAWLVGFGVGDIDSHPKHYHNRVRLVRAGL